MLKRLSYWQALRSAHYRAETCWKETSSSPPTISDLLFLFFIMEFSMSVDTEKCEHTPTNIHKLTHVSLSFFLIFASGCFTGSDGYQINLTLTKSLDHLNFSLNHLPELQSNPNQYWWSLINRHSCVFFVLLCSLLLGLYWYYLFTKSLILLLKYILCKFVMFFELVDSTQFQHCTLSMKKMNALITK